MSWTIPTPLQERLEDAECSPVILARINVPALHWLTVVDWTAGAGDTINVDGYATLTEGVDFNATTSNSATAQAIANAWNSDSDRLAGSQIRAIWRSGDRVAFRRMPHLDTTILLTTSDANAWDEVLPANPTEFLFCSHIGKLPDAFAGSEQAIPVIASMSGLEWTLDPVTREIGVPRVDLEFSGGIEIREIIDWYQLRRAVVDIYLGTDDLASTADYMQLPSLFIDDVAPSAGSINIKMVDALGDVWRDRAISGAFTGWHPLQVVEFCLLLAGARDGIHFDAASLVPATADSSRSHFCLSRFWDGEFTDEDRSVTDMKAGDAVAELLALMSGTFRPGQSGIYEYVAWDYNATAVASFEAGATVGHDVDEVEQDSALGMLINSATMKFGIFDNDRAIERTETDLLSYYESNGVLSDWIHRTEWINNIARLSLFNTRFDPVQTTGTGSVVIRDGTGGGELETISFPVDYASRMGFSGTQYIAPAPNGGPFATGMSLGSAAGRYVVIRLAGHPRQRRDGQNLPEFILGDQWVVWSDNPDSPSVQGSPQPSTTTPPLETAPSAGTVILDRAELGFRITNDPVDTLLPNGLTIGEFFGAGQQAGRRTGRGLGLVDGATTPGEWYANSDGTVEGGDELQIVDFTIPVYVTKEIVRRFKNGAPKIKLKTNLSEIAWEIGEFAVINGDDITVSYLRGTDGLTSQVVWEITGKKIDVFGDSPGVEWELTFVRDDALSEEVVIPALPAPPVIVPGVEVPGVSDDPVNNIPIPWLSVRSTPIRSRFRGSSRVFGPPLS